MAQKRQEVVSKPRILTNAYAPGSPFEELLPGARAGRAQVLEYLGRQSGDGADFDLAELRDRVCAELLQIKAAAFTRFADPFGSGGCAIDADENLGTKGDDLQREPFARFGQTARRRRNDMTLVSKMTQAASRARSFWVKADIGLQTISKGAQRIDAEENAAVPPGRAPQRAGGSREQA